MIDRSVHGAGAVVGAAMVGDVVPPIIIVGSVVGVSHALLAAHVPVLHTTLRDHPQRSSHDDPQAPPVSVLHESGVALSCRFCWDLVSSRLEHSRRARSPP